MVPLERTQAKSASDEVPGFFFPELKPLPEPEPRQPHSFKIVDVMTREVLAEGVDARAAVSALEDVNSIVDVTVSVWDPDDERWRLLSFGEKQALWDYRGRV
jgi:hypothetical protein